MDNPEQFLQNELFNKDEYIVLPNVAFSVSFNLSDSESVKQTHNPCTGFRAIKGDSDGKITHLLNLTNEPSRTVLSFHKLNYDRWSNFLVEFESLISRVSLLLGKYRVIRFGLQYQDVFIWIGGTPLSLNYLLQPESDYIPKVMMESGAVDFNLALNIGYLEAGQATETINIQTIDLPGVRVTHHLSVGDFEPVFIDDISTNDSFRKMLDTAHKHNKVMLSKILIKDLQDKITHSPLD